jgi:hypothetical protein
MHEAKMLHYSHDSFVSAVLEYGCNDGLQCRSDHLGCHSRRSVRDVYIAMDAVIATTFG